MGSKVSILECDLYHNTSYQKMETGGQNEVGGFREEPGSMASVHQESDLQCVLLDPIVLQCG